jgi:hypothetical protein
VIGSTDQPQQDSGYISATPDADRAARRGTGLY